MSDTKERILLTALELFAEKGYEAASVRDLAERLGLTKAALYKHYRNKRDLFDSILRRMERQDAEQAKACDLPEGSREKMEEAYRRSSLEDLCAFGKRMFRYWTGDPFASRFRRMLSLERFRDPEMGRLYQQYLVSGPLDYVAELLESMGLARPREGAAAFYAPMFLFYSLWDGTEDREALLPRLDALLDRERQRLEAGLEKGESMEKQDLVIRREKESDHRAVENLVRESFWNVYRPGCLEHYVLHRLRDDPAFVPQLDFVMEKDGELIGQNMFMRAFILADDGRRIPILTMGPICIAPEWKRRGYGKRLLDYSLEQAAALGFGALCFEGNIDFYGKSGFDFARSFGIRYRGLPEGADDSFFLCRELIPGYLQGVTGVYGPPEGYYAAEKEPEAFLRYDAQFPPKEKLKLPGQIF